MFVPHIRIHHVRHASHFRRLSLSATCVNPAAYWQPRFWTTAICFGKVDCSVFKPPFRQHQNLSTITNMASINDPNTQSNYHSVLTEFTTLDVALDFETSSVSGDVTLALRALKDDVREVLLDASYLNIKSVLVDNQDAEWRLGDRLEPYGSVLKISLSKTQRMKAISVKVKLRISIKTGVSC
jgi:hypothetical protein